MLNKSRVAYVNGKVVPEAEARISVFDRGFRWGDAVYDVIRTYNGEPFKLEDHLKRLYRSLRYTRIDPGMTIGELEAATRNIIEENRPLLAENDDYIVPIVISRGCNWPLHAAGTPTVTICCEPINFKAFARLFQVGARLATPATRRTPPQSLSASAKISNKMNHHVAEFEVKALDPEAIALMLDLDGNIAEGATFNFVFAVDGRLKIPRMRNVLPGIALQATMEIAEELGLSVEEGDHAPFDVYQAEEAMITQTTWGVVPVASLNGIDFPHGAPGPIIRRVWERLEQKTGVHVARQMLSHLSPEAADA